MTAAHVTLLNSEMHIMDSKQTGRQYHISVSLPLGYASTPGERWPFDRMPEKWPTVYVLDGNWNAGMVTGIIRPMCWCGSTSDAIVVGIGYGEDSGALEATRQAFTRRNADLTPTRVEAEEQSMEALFGRPVPFGDGPNFHKFIRDELIPLIETTYRADPAKRILAGHSYGGLSVLTGLFITPDLFESLIIGSPTMSYDNRVMFAQEEVFAKTQRRVPVRMFLFVGDLEESVTDTTMTDTLRLAALLAGRDYEGFTLMKRVFEDQNHCEVTAPGFQWGLKHALKKA